MNPAPAEPKLVTAADGAHRCGVPKSMVADWVSRGLLYAVGETTGKGSPRLYTLRRIRQLAVGYHARKREKAARKGAKK